MIDRRCLRYFDHNATTPVPRKWSPRWRRLASTFGNASSVHAYGQRAKAAHRRRQASVATLIGAEPAEVVFTAGGTEADNFALRGAAEAQEARGRKRLVTSTIEHEAVLNTCRHLARRGYDWATLPVDDRGVVTPERSKA